MPLVLMDYMVDDDRAVEYRRYMNLVPPPSPTGKSLADDDSYMHHMNLEPSPTLAPQAPPVSQAPRADGFTQYMNMTPSPGIDWDGVLHKIIDIGHVHLSPGSYFTKTVTDSLGDGIVKVGEGIGEGMANIPDSMSGVEAARTLTTFFMVVATLFFLTAVFAGMFMLSRRVSRRRMEDVDMTETLHARTRAEVETRIIALDHARADTEARLLALDRARTEAEVKKKELDDRIDDAQNDLATLMTSYTSANLI